MRLSHDPVAASFFIVGSSRCFVDFLNLNVFISFTSNSIGVFCLAFDDGDDSGCFGLIDGMSDVDESRDGGGSGGGGGGGGGGGLENKKLV